MMLATAVLNQQGATGGGVVYDSQSTQTANNTGSLSFSMTLPAGRLLILHGVWNGGNNAATLTVDGGSTTHLVSDTAGNNVKLHSFEYTNASAGSSTLAFTYAATNAVQSSTIVYVMPAGTITATAVGTPTVASDEWVAEMAMTQNASAIVLTATNALTVDSDVDVRSNEYVKAGHLNGATVISAPTFTSEGSSAIRWITVVGPQ